MKKKLKELLEHKQNVLFAIITEIKHLYKKYPDGPGQYTDKLSEYEKNLTETNAQIKLLEFILSENF